MSFIKKIKVAKIIIRELVTHPLNRKHKLAAVWRFLKWQIRIRVTSKPLVHQFTEKSKLIINKGMPGATTNLYCGLHEYNDMSFLLHFLRPGDLFVDIGANIGSYTILASAHVGANSITVEPVPFTFKHIQQNIAVNKISDKVTPLNIALGAKAGKVNFTSAQDAENHVATGNDVDIIEVPVETLDDILQNSPPPILIKIDVEGFETEVVKGAAKTLADEGLKAVIIELNGSGNWRYGYDEGQIHAVFISLGFKPFLYDPAERSFTAKEKIGAANTIYLREIDFVTSRVKTAEAFTIYGNKI